MNNSTQTKHMTARNSRGFIKSSKGFYIGDITNVLDPFELCMALGNEHGCPTGIVRMNARFQIGVAYTGRNDCTFADNKGNRYAVDSGLLGIVPLELVSTDHPKHGLVINEPGAAWFSHNNDGVFDFYVPSHTHIHLDTNEPVGR